jgi:hypothetical protein
MGNTYISYSLFGAVNRVRGNSACAVAKTLTSPCYFPFVCKYKPSQHTRSPVHTCGTHMLPCKLGAANHLLQKNHKGVM